MDEAVARGARLPLAGLTLAVKNNVDVAGLVTTAGCPAFGAGPAATDATSVDRLTAAGAVVIGATNLDQFATGLVGTRSPFGAVRDARRPDRISGGSSSGSAVAVALGLADIAIGTDTAGSGRVPAALQGIVGIKGTVGVVSRSGVVPACRSYDCVTVFARDLDTAETAMGIMAGGPDARRWPDAMAFGAPPDLVVALPGRLPALSAAWATAFAAAVDRLRAAGVTTVTVDPTPFLAAARLLYGGGLVAERYAAVGTFVDTHRDQVDPVVGAIIAAAGRVPAWRLVRDLERLEEFRAAAMSLLDGASALLVPTTTEHPGIAEVAADPVGVNARLGTYTNFCNLFDMCAVAVPTGTAGSDQFGVSVLGRAFDDAVVGDVARLLVRQPPPVCAPGAAGPVRAEVPWPVAAGARAQRLFAVGAHLPGRPLAGELTCRGARWLGEARTAQGYRLLELGTEPAKPGLVRSVPGGPAGGVIEGGVWLLSEAALGSVLADLPHPMTLGPVDLSDGSVVVGFGCDHPSAVGAPDLTAQRRWNPSAPALPSATAP